MIQVHLSASERLLPTNVVAQKLHKSQRTVRWYAKTGQLRAVRVGAKLWKFRRSDVDEFMSRFCVSPREVA